MRIGLPTRRTWILVGKILVLVAVALGVGRAATSAFNDLAREGWNPSRLNPRWLLLAVASYLVGQSPGWYFWHRLLEALGQRPRIRESLRAWFIGHLGKYVPGKAMVVVLRTGLVRSGRTSGTLATVAVFYETLTTMAAGALLAAAILAFRFRSHPQLLLAALAMLAVVGIPTIPALFRRLPRLLPLGKIDPTAADRLAEFRLRSLAPGWLALVAGWFFVGASLWATMHAAGYAPLERAGAGDSGWSGAFDLVMVCTAAAAMAVVAGFLSFVPGGFFVREAVLLILLAPVYGEAGALVAAVLVRLVWLVAEVAMALVLWLRHTRNTEPITEPS